MNKKIDAIHIAVHEPKMSNIGWAYFFRGEECNSYLVKPGSRRYHRAIMAQMALIDPRTVAQVAADEHDRDVHESNESVRPF